MKRWIFVGILVALGITAGVACGGSSGGSQPSPTASVPTATPAPDTGLRIGDLAPDFTVEEAVNWTESPLPFKLSDLRGRVVLLNFWASWCPPCKQEMPALQALHDRYKTEGLVVLGIDKRESRETVVSFMESLDLTFPSVLDRGAIANAYGGVRNIPTTYILDKKGVIRAFLIGGPRPFDSLQYHSFIEFLLSEEP